MNRYPVWKLVLMALVLLWGALYALPNLYGSDPSLQISKSSRGPFHPAELQARVKQALQQAGLPAHSVEVQDKGLLLRYQDTETQLKARDILDATLGSDYTVALNLTPALPDWLKSFGAAPMYLGLDLRGGVHFLIEVDMKAAVDKAVDRAYTDMRNTLRSAKVRYKKLNKRSDGSIDIVFAAGARDLVEAASKAVAKSLPDMERELLETNAATTLRVRYSESAISEIKSFALEQNITTLRNRVNELGVAEPLIQRQGDARIVVQMPGIQDTARAKKLLGATATLEFRMVDDKGDLQNALTTGRAPAGSKIYSTSLGNKILLKSQVMLTGDYITDASSGIDTQSGGPAVFINLDGKGGKIMARKTQRHIGHPMGVVFIETKYDSTLVNGKVVRSKRVVEEVINTATIQGVLGRRFQITGLDSTSEAHDLALLLRAGALSVPIEIVEERTIGPSLGQDNIDQGFNSVKLGFLMVLIYMVWRYRALGMIANIALAMNLVLTVAALSLLQATLTLPGIAGIVLTVGMAVDANVLIFERIREELRLGVAAHTAIQAGYDKAFSTIADANITTLIAAVVLYGFGTGPIKGFAITLSLGIVSSMLTAIMGTRSLVGLLYGKQRQPKLSIGRY